MLTIIEFDLLQVKSGIIAHQVNLKGKMGAGLAKQLRCRYPQAYLKYQNACARGLFKLGQIQIVKVNESPLYIAHLAGQESYGRHRQHTDYAALAQCLKKFYATSQKLNLTSYLPYGIGCGLAGGSWDVVALLIEQYCPNAVVCRL